MDGTFVVENGSIADVLAMSWASPVTCLGWQNRAGGCASSSAFATEPYLKTLGLLYGKKLHGHDLEKAFSRDSEGASERG
jgi:hypothetical protein